MKFSDGTELVRATKFQDGEQLTLDLLLIDEAHAYWQTRQRLPFGSGMLSVVSRETLIQMKASAARPPGHRRHRQAADIDR
jgi:hypothetical protein